VIARILRLAVVVPVMVLATALPALADSNASVDHVCTSPGTVTRPPGPPPADNYTVVMANGRLVALAYVPGPCGAPGFVKTHS
jgi:hypothetical protein